MKYPHSQPSEDLSPDEELTLCSNCDNYCMRKWRGERWAWCSVHQNWINQAWVACDSHRPASRLKYFFRGPAGVGGKGYNPLPPYMARDYKLVEEETG